MFGCSAFKIISRNQYALGPDMVGVGVFHHCEDFGRRRILSPRMMVCALSLSLAFGAAEARAAKDAAAIAISQTALNSGDVVRDLGALSSPSNADTSETSPSASTVSSAQPVPELPTWAMILLCFAGLGLAGLKRGRKDRLSPGID
jgi:hypothetical protein